MLHSTIVLLSLLLTSLQFQTQSQFLKQSVHSFNKHYTELNENKQTETVNRIYLNCGNEQIENTKKSM